MLRSTRRPLLPALALLTLTLAACGQTSPTATAPVSDARPASVTLRLPAPQGLSAQYINQNKTTRLDVQIDGGTTASYTLGSAAAPCANGFCTVTLLNVPSGSHTFTFGTYGVKPANSTAVLISQGSLTATPLAGQANTFPLTLTPVNTTLNLNSAVRQYDPVSKTLGNSVRFTTFGGRSLPVYYDPQITDSLGDPITGPSVLCGDAGTAVTNISDPTFPNRFRVEVQTLGAHTLTLKTGSDCLTGTALGTASVRGQAPGASNGGLSLGSVQSLALSRDGTLRGWGNNSSGQLSDGTTTKRPTPVTAQGTGDIVDALTNGAHSMFLQRNGSVLAVGFNSDGELGNGTTISSLTPVTVSGLQTAVQLGDGYYHVLALLNTGAVQAWGYNGTGQLGDGTTTTRSTPVSVPGLSDIVQVQASTFSSYALRADGTVFSWGQNTYGQLGDGTTTTRSTPVAIPGLKNIAQVTSGSAHVLALTGDGTVRAWGLNSTGQLGDGTLTTRLTPTVIPGLSGVAHVRTGYGFSLALMQDGRVQSWGSSAYGALGDGTRTDRSTPASIPGLSTVTAISTGSSHAAALLSDGTVRLWGSSSSGQIGDGTLTDRRTPTDIGVSGLLQPDEVTVPVP